MDVLNTSSRLRIPGIFQIVISNIDVKADMISKTSFIVNTLLTGSVFMILHNGIRDCIL